jgi:hypothetical protein
MNEQFLTPQRLRDAQFVTAMSAVRYPGYPDPSTESGWAEVPAVVLLVDFKGREDVVYTAMMQAAPLEAEDAGLAISAGVDGASVYLFAVTFNGVEPLDLAGVAPEEARLMFANAEMVLLASADQERDGGAPILAFVPNDPLRWVA